MPSTIATPTLTIAVGVARAFVDDRAACGAKSISASDYDALRKKHLEGVTRRFAAFSCRSHSALSHSCFETTWESFIVFSRAIGSAAIL